MKREPAETSNAAEVASQEAQPSQQSEPVHPEDAAALWMVLVNAASLAVFLVVIRAEKMLRLPIQLDLGSAALALLPELGFVLLFASGWLVVARLCARRAMLFRGPFFLSLAVVYALAIAGHQFYRRTGAVQDLDALLFAIEEFAELSKVLATGIDYVFWIHLVVAIGFVAFGLLPLRGRRVVRGKSIVVAGVCVLAGWAFTSLPAPEPARLRVLASHFARDLFVPGDFMLDGLELDLHGVYVAPQLRAQNAARRPNVLLLVMESTRADTVGAYRSPGRVSGTPTFDALAAEGLLIERAYTTVTHTSKALIGILCGMYAAPEMQIVEAEPGWLPLTCLPQLLEQLGYRTGFFQSAGDFESRRELVANLGFGTAKIGDDYAPESLRPIGYLGWDEYAMLKPALDWVTAREDPFLLTVLSLSTHDPYQLAGQDAPEASSAQDRARYREAVHHVDSFFGELIQGLRDAGKLDNTLIVMVGDHGEAFGEHQGRLQHDIVPYEEGVRIPMLLHGPSLLGAPRRVQGLRQTTDLVPTVLDVLDVPWDGLLPGKSLLEPEGHARVITACWYTAHCMSLLEGSMKYVFHFGRLPMEAFDLAADPGERSNLAEGLDTSALEQAESTLLSTYASVAAYYRGLRLPPRALAAERLAP